MMSLGQGLSGTLDRRDGLAELMKIVRRDLLDKEGWPEVNFLTLLSPKSSRRCLLGTNSSGTPEGIVSRGVLPILQRQALGTCPDTPSRRTDSGDPNSLFMDI